MGAHQVIANMTYTIYEYDTGSFLKHKFPYPKFFKFPNPQKGNPDGQVNVHETVSIQLSAHYHLVRISQYLKTPSNTHK